MQVYFDGKARAVWLDKLEKAVVVVLELHCRRQSSFHVRTSADVTRPHTATTNRASKLYLLVVMPTAKLEQSSR